MSATQFVETWHRRAGETPDCFDRFFSAWISLIIEARRHLNAQQLAEADTDRKTIVQYFENRNAVIAAVLQKLPEQTGWLAARRGTGTGGPILDVNVVNTYTTELRRELDELALFWSGNDKPRKPGWIATRTAEMLNHIRNNLFHGIKAPDDEADRALLEHVNPILLGILEARNG
jgi:hypothetical protein